MTALRIYKDFEIGEVCRGIDDQGLADRQIAGNRHPRADCDRRLGELSLNIFEACMAVNQRAGLPYRIRRGESEEQASTVTPLKMSSLFSPPPRLDVPFFTRNALGMHAKAYYQAVDDAKIDMEVFASVGDGEGVACADRVNEFVGMLRSYTRSSSFKRGYAASQEICKSGYRHAESLLRAAHNRCDFLTLVRLDLYSAPGMLSGQNTRMEWLAGELMKRLRRHPVYRSLAGYVWGLQHSSYFDLSAHLMLLVEGVCDADGLAACVRETWVGEVNGGCGAAATGSCHPNAYKRMAHGVVRNDDVNLYFDVLASLAQWAKTGIFFPASAGIRTVRLK